MPPMKKAPSKKASRAVPKKKPGRPKKTGPAETAKKKVKKVSYEDYVDANSNSSRGSSSASSDSFESVDSEPKSKKPKLQSVTPDLDRESEFGLDFGCAGIARDAEQLEEKMLPEEAHVKLQHKSNPEFRKEVWACAWRNGFREPEHHDELKVDALRLEGTPAVVAHTLKFLAARGAVQESGASIHRRFASCIFDKFKAGVGGAKKKWAQFLRGCRVINDIELSYLGFDDVGLPLPIFSSLAAWRFGRDP
jgi:hypothetical protein